MNHFSQAHWSPATHATATQTTANSLLASELRERLAAGNEVELPITGQSMLPTLKPGDRAMVAALTSEPLIGDILLFEHEGRHLLHRLVKRRKSTLIMLGDNNLTQETIDRSAVIARVTAIRHADGSITACSRSPLRALAKRFTSTLKRLYKHALERPQLLAKRLSPWYFISLTALMWLPLNGLDIPLDNFVFGIRGDHLVHASVYIPCTWFIPLKKRGFGLWLLGASVGIVTESVQYVLPYRGFDINDMVANIMGMTLGWAIAKLIARKKNSKHITAA